MADDEGNVMGLHGTPRPAGLPVIGSSEAAGQALGDLFLSNADRGDDAANDHLVAELVRRIRAQQDSVAAVAASSRRTSRL